MTREGGEESRFVDLTPPCIRDRRIDFTRDNEISIDIFPFVRRFFSSSFFQTAITLFKLLKIRIIRTIIFLADTRLHLIERFPTLRIFFDGKKDIFRDKYIYKFQIYVRFLISIFIKLQAIEILY